MEIQTKYSIVSEFINDIIKVVDKVNANTANDGDYIKLKEYFTMVGIKGETVDNVYLDCGFNDFKDFRKQRNFSKKQQTGNISRTISKINGMKEGVVEFLDLQLLKEKRKHIVK